MSKNGFLERSKGNTLDFNDYTISGVWVFSDTGFINGPSVYRGGILLVFKTANGNILQICCDYTNSILYVFIGENGNLGHESQQW